MNKSDSERITAVLKEAGYKLASSIQEADLVLTNMCSVRQSAVDRVYGLIPKFKNLKKKNSNLKTLLTGCILKKDKKKFAKEFDFVLNIKDLLNWSRFQNLKKAGRVYKDYLDVSPKYQNDFSAFIPISNGCNNFCAYCVVPYVRGFLVCRNHEKILDEARNVIRGGFKEIWLLGQNVNDYQSPIDSSIHFPELLRKINQIEGDFWIRFTSPNPKDFSENLIKTMANSKKFAQYLNLPVQSGNNDVLKRMNRPYKIEQYKKLVKKIREKIPGISLSTDVIVGFPGETKKQFENTEKLLKEIKYDMAYIAQYSPRSQTAAFKLKDDVPHQEKERRFKILSGILRKTALEKNKKLIGKTVEVLVMKNKKNFCMGKNRTYKTVKFEVPGSRPQDLIGQFVEVKIVKALPWGLEGLTKLK